MDFVDIARRTSPDIADKLQSDRYFDEHIAGQGQDVDGERLDDLTRGAVILGVEPIDYPLTDGLYIYLKRPAGDVIALLIETDTAAEFGNCTQCGGGLYDVLRISKAMIA